MKKINNMYLNNNHIQRLMHALGIPTVYKGKMIKKIEHNVYNVCRNYFTGEDEIIKELCNYGLMKEIKKDYFVVTKKGVSILENYIEVLIQFRDYEDVYE